MATVEIALADGTRMPTLTLTPATPRVPQGDSEPPRYAGVIVIHDILGLTADTRRIAERLTTLSTPLVVAAPDLYAGLGIKPLCVVRTISSLRRGSGAPFERLRATQTWLAERADVDADRIAVIGFCMGGGFALLHAARETVAVAAPFYGDVPENKDALRGICPVVGGYGERDKLFAPQGRRLTAHLDALDVPHDVAFYPDAGHSYMNVLKGVARLGRYSPMRAAYNEDAAEDSWRRIDAFLAQHL